MPDACVVTSKTNHNDRFPCDYPPYFVFARLPQLLTLPMLSSPLPAESLDGSSML